MIAIVQWCALKMRGLGGIRKCSNAEMFSAIVEKILLVRSDELLPTAALLSTISNVTAYKMEGYNQWHWQQDRNLGPAWIAPNNYPTKILALTVDVGGRLDGCRNFRFTWTFCTAVQFARQNPNKPTAANSFIKLLSRP